MKKIITTVLSLALCAASGISMVGCQRPADPNTVRIVMDSKYETTFRPMFDDFTDKTGYKVDPIFTADPTTKQDNMIGAGDYPDIIFGGDQYVEKYAKNALDLSFLKDDPEYDFDDIYENLVAPLYSGDKLVFAPRTFTASLLYYNVDLVESEDYPEPVVITEEDPDGLQTGWTYDEFYAVAQKYQKINTADTSQNYYGCTADTYYWSEWGVMLRQAGGDFFDDEGYVTLDTPEAELAFTIFMEKQFGAPLTEQNGKYVIQNSRISPTVTEPSFDGFGSGRYAFSFGGHTANWAQYRERNLNFDIARLPLVEQLDGTLNRKGGELAVEGFAICKYTKSLDAAKEFIKYMTGKECMSKAKDVGYVPVRESVAQEMLSVPKEERVAPKNLEVLFESIEDSQTMPSLYYFTEIMQNVVKPELYGLLNNTALIAESLEKATETANTRINLMYK